MSYGDEEIKMFKRTTDAKTHKVLILPTALLEKVLGQKLNKTKWQKK